MQENNLHIIGRALAVLLALTITISYVSSEETCFVSAVSASASQGIEKTSDGEATKVKMLKAERITKLVNAASDFEPLILPVEKITIAAAPVELPENVQVPTESNDARYQYILGTDYKPYTMYDAPKEYRSDRSASRNMRTITVPVWKMRDDGERYPSTYTFSINKKLYDNVKAIFDEIYSLDLQFPIKYMVGYKYRKVGGVGLMSSPFMSIHTFGCAIDINPGDYDNDYYLGKGNDLRDKTNPYCIPDEVIEIFEKYGWYWGGNFEICSDTMHFQYFELGFLQYDKEEPFPILSMGAGSQAKYVQNLTERLAELDYMTGTSTTFDVQVHEAVVSFQQEHGLEPNGIVDYATWETLINLTHYLDFVF